MQFEMRSPVPLTPRQDEVHTLDSKESLLHEVACEWHTPPRFSRRLLCELPFVDLLPELVSKADSLASAAAHVSAAVAPMGVRVARASLSHRAGCDAVLDALTNSGVRFNRMLSSAIFKLNKEYDAAADDAENASKTLDAACALSHSWQATLCSLEAALSSLRIGAALADTVAQISTGSSLLATVCSALECHVVPDAVRDLAINGKAATACGAGLRLFTPGPASTETTKRNSFELTLFDEAGKLADFVCASDIDVQVCLTRMSPGTGIQLNSTPDTLTCAVVLSCINDGHVCISYAVPNMMQLVDLRTRVCGVDIPAGCVEVRSAYPGGSPVFPLLLSPCHDHNYSICYSAPAISSEHWHDAPAHGWHFIPTVFSDFYRDDFERKGPWHGTFNDAKITLTPSEWLYYSNPQIRQSRLTLGSLSPFRGYVRGALGAAVLGDKLCVKLAFDMGAYAFLLRLPSGTPIHMFSCPRKRDSGSIDGSLVEVQSAHCTSMNEPSVFQANSLRSPAFAMDDTALQVIGSGLRQLGAGWLDITFAYTDRVIVANINNHRVVLFRLDCATESSRMQEP